MLRIIFALVLGQLARVNLEGVCQRANRGHVGLGAIFLDAVNRVLAAGQAHAPHRGRLIRGEGKQPGRGTLKDTPAHD